MSDNTPAPASAPSNAVQNALDTVLGSWESAVEKIRHYKQQAQAKLETLAALPTATSAQTLGVLRGFHDQVKNLRTSLTQPVPDEALQHVEAVAAIAGSSSAAASVSAAAPVSSSAVPASGLAPAGSSSAALAVPATPAPKGQAKLAVPKTRVAGTPNPFAARVESDSEDVADKTAQRSSNKSGPSSIASKKDDDVEGKGKGRAKSLSPLPYSPKTIEKINRAFNVYGPERRALPLLKPVGSFRPGGGAGASSSRAVSAPAFTSPIKRGTLPVFEASSDEESDDGLAGYTSLKGLPAKKRLPLVKPAGVLTGDLVPALLPPSQAVAAAGPSRVRFASPVAAEQAKSDSEEETTEFLSVLEFQDMDRDLSASPDASSTPGPALRAAAVASAAVNSPTPNAAQEESAVFAHIEDEKKEDEVIESEPTTTATGNDNSNNANPSGSGYASGAASGSNSPMLSNTAEVDEDFDIVSFWDGDVEATKKNDTVKNTATKATTTASGSGNTSLSGSNIATSNNMPVDLDDFDIVAIWDADKKEDKASSAPTKQSPTTASGSGSIAPRKDLKGKGKAIARSPSPSLSPKNNGNRVTKNKTNKKENKRSPSPAATASFEQALTDTLNNNPTTNNNDTAKEQTVTTVSNKLDKGKGKTTDTPTAASTTTQIVDNNDVTTTTPPSNSAGATASTTSSNNNDKTITDGNNMVGTSGSNSIAGAGSITSKKDVKGKGKAVSRSPTPDLSPKNKGNRVTKTSKKDLKENRPLAKRTSPEPAFSSNLNHKNSMIEEQVITALNEKSNKNDKNDNNGNTQEETVHNTKPNKGKGKEVATTAAPAPVQTTTDVIDVDEAVVITTTTTTTATASTLEVSTSSSNTKLSNNASNNENTDGSKTVDITNSATTSASNTAAGTTSTASSSSSAVETSTSNINKQTGNGETDSANKSASTNVVNNVGTTNSSSVAATPSRRSHTRSMSATISASNMASAGPSTSTTTSVPPTPSRRIHTRSLSATISASNAAGPSTGPSTSTTTPGRGAIASKRDRTVRFAAIPEETPRGKGKARATTPARPRSVRPRSARSRTPSPPAAGPSRAPGTPKTQTASTTKPASSSSSANKVTKRPASVQERETIKRSLAKKGEHWAFKLEASFARDAEDVEANKDKFFILCCPAPSCTSPNFGGKHPFREGRALAHFARDRRDEKDGDESMADETGLTDLFEEKKNPCLMEIDGEDLLDGDGDVEMTEAEIFDRFGCEIVPEQKRWKVNEKWVRENNSDLCKKVPAGEERDMMLMELEESV